MNAAKDLGPHALLLYLYLAANKDKYELALSPAAIGDAIGMARSTYHDQFHKLQKKGYIIPAHGSTFDFYEVPQFDSRTRNNELSAGHTLDFDSAPAFYIPPDELDGLGQDIEINNREMAQIGEINNGEFLGNKNHPRAQKKYAEGFVF